MRRGEICIHGRNRAFHLRDALYLHHPAIDFTTCWYHQLVEGIQGLYNFSVDRLTNSPNAHFLTQCHFEWRTRWHTQWNGGNRRFCRRLVRWRLDGLSGPAAESLSHGQRSAKGGQQDNPVYVPHEFFLSSLDARKCDP